MPLTLPAGYLHLGGDIFDYTANEFTLDSPAAVEAWTLPAGSG
jgi:hypothetical protein